MDSQLYQKLYESTQMLGSIWKYFNPKTELKYIWFKGSHSVNVYLGHENVDCVSIGDFANDKASENDFFEYLARIIEVEA